MIMGALFEIAVFVFIMQSTTILDIFLNFAALEFITSVDEFAFQLAKRGYVSNAVKKSCDEVSEIKVLRRKGGRVCRRLQMVIFIFAMLGAYALLANWQDRGKFDCEKIEVQFGDGFSESRPALNPIELFRSHLELIAVFPLFSHNTSSIFRRVYLHQNQSAGRRQEAQSTRVLGQTSWCGLSVLSQR